MEKEIKKCKICEEPYYPKEEYDNGACPQCNERAMYKSGFKK